MTEIQRSMLGMCIGQSSRLAVAVDLGVSPQHFPDADVRQLYAKMVELDREGKPIDVMSLVREMPEARTLLTDLVKTAPIGQNFEPYAKEVIDLAWQQQASLALQALAGRVRLRQPFEDVEHYRDEVAKLIAQLANAPEETGPTPIAKVADKMLAQIESRLEGKDVAIKTSLHLLDRALGGGWRKSRLYVPAARPGMGKTTFVVNAMDAASAAGKAVLFFTIEMASDQIAVKHVSLLSAVKGSRIDRGELDERQCDKLQAAVQAMTARRIWIDDKSKGDVDYICAHCRRMKRQGNLDLVVIDYLQLLRIAGRFQSRQAELTAITAIIKRLTVELEVPIVLLSTINRSAESSERPGMHHLKDSGSIEQDADAVMIFYRHDKETMVALTKNRQGPETSFAVETDLAINVISDVNTQPPLELRNV